MTKPIPTTSAADPASALVNVAGKTSALAHEMVERARQTSLTVRDKAAQASDRAVTYVQEEPVKAVLISAAAGAVLTALAGWLLRSRS